MTKQVKTQEENDDVSKSFLNKPINSSLVCFGKHYMINRSSFYNLNYDIFKGNTIDGSLDLLFF